MIYTKVNSNKYREDFTSKFENFGDKSPILLSFFTDDLGVTVIHENSGNKYFYEWDYSIPVKTFIHNIKQELSSNHYPRIAREEETITPVSSEKAAEMISNGCPVDQIPSSLASKRTVVYRIDKVIAMKDEFVLLDEDTGEQYCYKMNGSSVYFLKNYRKGAFRDIREAGDAFFKKSTLIGKIEPKKKG